MKKFFIDKWQFLAVIIISFATVLNDVYYIFLTHQYPEMDEQHYMYMASGYYRLIQHISWVTPFSIITYFPLRQPGYPLLILPFLLVSGLTSAYKIALLVNGLLFFGTIITIYFLGRELFNKTVGFVASLLFACYGWTLFYLHFTYSETATTFFVVVALLLLLKSHYFLNLKYTLLFSIVFAYGIFVRWVVPLFIIGPLLLVIYTAYRQDTRKTSIKNFSLSLIFLIPAIIPYIANKDTIVFYFTEQFFKSSLWKQMPLSRRNHISLQSAVYYFKVFEQLSIFFFLLFILGIFRLFVKRNWKHIFLFLGLFLPYIAFSFGSVLKDDRYIVPIYPIIALISAGVIEWFHKKIYTVIFLTLLSFLCICSFLGGLWGIGPMGHGLQSILISIGIGHPRTVHIASIVWPPTKQYTDVDELFRFLKQDSKKNNTNTTVFQLFSYHPVDSAIYAINSYEEVNPYTIESIVGMSPLNPAKTALYIIKVIKKSDYVLVKTNYPIDTYFPSINYITLRAAITAFNYTLSNNRQAFTIAKTIKISQDHSTLIVYKNNKSFSDKFLSDYKSIFIKTIR